MPWSHSLLGKEQGEAAARLPRLGMAEKHQNPPAPPPPSAAFSKAPGQTGSPCNPSSSSAGPGLTPRPEPASRGSFASYWFYVRFSVGLRQPDPEDPL